MFFKKKTAQCLAKTWHERYKSFQFGICELDI